ncbi:hypothetical protein [Aminobacter sp. LjRoot7]|uniref:hypothetical protein n=1 Tax=Aminobacter sp. LjRoot7 TaxID=3342335 RepID=UPI003ECF2CE4
MTESRRYTSVEEQVVYGLDTIPADRMVSMPLRELMFVFETMGELNRFFHQPLHYRSLADVKTFLGSKEGGALQLIQECYYRKLRNALPPDIEAEFDGDRFNHPDSPYYHQGE